MFTELIYFPLIINMCKRKSEIIVFCNDLTTKRFYTGLFLLPQWDETLRLTPTINRDESWRKETKMKTSK
jgi:hypothetical protein